jgi:bacteriophage N4 adsorption protein B
MYDAAQTLASMISALSIVVALGYLILGIDDIAIDLIFWYRLLSNSLFGPRYPRLTLETLHATREQRIAIFVPCWHEAEVIDRVLSHACETIDYDNYDILVGVYPNDLATLAKVQEISARHTRVRAVVNEREGPTTKGQNLNAIFARMLETEGDEPYKIVVLHDAEDVIHPYSLLLYNRLIPRKSMVQLPVFPLETKVQKWTAWTYADEFAEWHLKDLLVRELVGGFVPSAGVGCAFDRFALAGLASAAEEVFPSASLTEDYVLGLRLSMQGGSTILVHQILRQPRKRSRYVTASSYVATREFFPDTVRAAIRQKRRWAMGICFQAWQATGWVGGLATRYALYRDRKGILGNPLTLFGYVLMLGGAVLFGWHAFDDQIALPSAGSQRAVWALFDVVLAMTLLRLVEKSYFVSSMYGPWQGVFAVLRIPWAGYINGIATLTAAAAFFNAARRGRSLAWQKTAHAFPTSESLRNTV